MTIPQLMPWIGGPAKFEAGLSPLVCPTDDSVASHMIESDAKIVDAAVKHSHAAFLQHQDATAAKRVEWLLAAADAIDKIEGEIVRSAWACSCARALRRCRTSWARCCRST
jgi:acyl-CoA reductase-like NAD-dependent aldehyde dehydrogenase